jgi:hypothetical protein
MFGPLRLIMRLVRLVIAGDRGSRGDDLRAYRPVRPRRPRMPRGRSGGIALAEPEEELLAVAVARPRTRRS